MTHTHPSEHSPIVGELSVVEIGPEGFALERWSETGEWERLGVYADFATADEIRRIATSNPDRGHAYDGRTPKQAIPVAPADLVEMFSRGATRLDDNRRPGVRR